MKNILIFGATGRTGKYLMDYALANGYSVTALVRNPDKITLSHPNLKLIKGSPYNLEDVKKAMPGMDAVLSVLNNPRSSDMPWAKQTGPTDVLNRSISNALVAMKENGVKRIINMAAVGVGDSWNITAGLLKWMIRKTNLKVVYADHEAVEKTLQASSVDWTSLRPVGLGDYAKEKRIAVTYTEKPGGFMPMVSRENVAKFMVDIIDDTSYFGKAPVLFDK